MLWANASGSVFTFTTQWARLQRCNRAWSVREICPRKEEHVGDSVLRRRELSLLFRLIRRIRFESRFELPVLARSATPKLGHISASNS